MDVRYTSSISSIIRMPLFSFAHGATLFIIIFLNYFIEQDNIDRQSGYGLFVTSDQTLKVISFVLLASVMFYFMSFQLLRYIATRRCPSILQSRLRSLPFPLSHICGYSGDRRLITFIFQMALVPGLLMTGILHLLSYLNGKSAVEWEMAANKYIAFNSMWKAATISFIFTVNFLAALNSSQSIIQELDRTSRRNMRKIQGK